ncbi:MAG TPA: hypothetical protein VFA36_03570 [Burkholderiales bacterium]|nr:hypothetical protein [Burkholderiales bacterium]
MPLILDRIVAPMTGSGAKRRPNPPPRYMVLTFTCPGWTPATWERMPCAGPCDCVPAQISTPSFFTQAVQLSGSMQECERKGASYSASRVFAGAAAFASPSLRPTAPPALAPSESIFEMPSEESVALGPSSHLISSASRPVLAAQYPSASTATPAGMVTTWRTPGTAFALESSTETGLPPSTGECAITAVSMPGR